MCAIFGADNIATFNKLYQENICRGNAAFGMLALPPSARPDQVIPAIQKHKGVVNLLDPHNNVDGSYFVGHTQAPTSRAQEFDAKTTHPFTKGSWTVAHNGVLTNFDRLKRHLPYTHHNPVDSSIIPALMDFYAPRLVATTPAEFFIQILEMLEGTHTTWICDRLLNKIWLARCGSTLFANSTERTFSSVQLPGMVELEDGGLYEICKDAIKQVGNFNQKSPFYIL